jgi:hypothetical protein
MAYPSPDLPERRLPASSAGRQPEVRIGDADRQAIVGRLQAALGEGRLDLHEFDERVALAYAAKTERDLVPLTADLPAWPGVAPRPPVYAAPASGRLPRYSGGEVVWFWLAVILTGIWVVASVAHGGVDDFWPAMPLGAWGALLLAHRLVRGPS